MQVLFVHALKIDCKKTNTLIRVSYCFQFVSLNLQHLICNNKIELLGFFCMKLRFFSIKFLKSSVFICQLSVSFYSHFFNFLFVIVNFLLIHFYGHFLFFFIRINFITKVKDIIIACDLIKWAILSGDSGFSLFFWFKFGANHCLKFNNSFIFFNLKSVKIFIIINRCNFINFTNF